MAYEIISISKTVFLSETVASGGSSPSTTFETLNGPNRLAGGTQVAAGFADLTDGGHGAFNQTANGTNSVISFVWAMTLADGTANARPQRPATNGRA